MYPPVTPPWLSASPYAPIWRWLHWALAAMMRSGGEKAHDMEVLETIGELTVMLLIPGGVVLLLLLVLVD
jgi:hypothetical protein